MIEELIEVEEKWDMDGRLLQMKIGGKEIEIPEYLKDKPMITVNLPKDKFNWVSQKRLIPKECLKYLISPLTK